MDEIFLQDITAFQARMLMVWVEVQEMIAENAWRVSHGLSPAYCDGWFSEVLKRHNINENSFPIYRGG